MLQPGLEMLGGKLLMLLRASLALGYIPMSWKHTRVVFITKPGKSLTQAKFLRPISLMSVMLDILKKLLDRNIRGGVLVENPLHQNKFTYRTGMSTDTLLYQVVRRLEIVWNTRSLRWVLSWISREHLTTPRLMQ
jgi:hypothetical protein